MTRARYPDGVGVGVGLGVAVGVAVGVAAGVAAVFSPVGGVLSKTGLGGRAVSLATR
ncbi:MAG: hypothetical protein WBF52_16720 [Geitlerinemataceae cyanobacterium]